MKLYLDSCCLNRPYDDLSQDKNRMESEAVLIIIDHYLDKNWNIFSSDILIDEAYRNPNIWTREKVLTFLSSFNNHIELNDDIINRAKELSAYGLKSYDALHISSAEYAEMDVFLTTERKLLNAANKANLSVRVMNPLMWIMEVFDNE